MEIQAAFELWFCELTVHGNFHLMQALRGWETSDILRYCQNVVTLRLTPAKLDWSRQKGAPPGILPWSTAWGWREPVPWPTRVLYGR